VRGGLRTRIKQRRAQQQLVALDTRQLGDPVGSQRAMPQRSNPRLLEPPLGSQQIADRYDHHYPSAQAVEWRACAVAS
jgi:hypothetical protein